jgi:hypothetical protein
VSFIAWSWKPGLGGCQNAKQTHRWVQRSWDGVGYACLVECTHYPTLGNSSLLLCTAQEDRSFRATVVISEGRSCRLLRFVHADQIVSRPIMYLDQNLLCLWASPGESFAVPTGLRLGAFTWQCPLRLSSAPYTQLSESRTSQGCSFVFTGVITTAQSIASMRVSSWDCTCPGVLLLLYMGLGFPARDWARSLAYTHMLTYALAPIGTPDSFRWLLISWGSNLGPWAGFQGAALQALGVVLHLLLYLGSSNPCCTVNCRIYQLQSSRKVPCPLTLCLWTRFQGVAEENKGAENFFFFLNLWTAPGQRFLCLMFLWQPVPAPPPPQFSNLQWHCDIDVTSAHGTVRTYWRTHENRVLILEAPLAVSLSWRVYVTDPRLWRNTSFFTEQSEFPDKTDAQKIRVIKTTGN